VTEILINIIAIFGNQQSDTIPYCAYVINHRIN